MATKASTTGKDATKGPAALDRLGGSLDAAGEALKDLRRELSKGGRDALRDFDTLLKDARKNLRGARRTLVKDLEDMQNAAAGKRGTAPKRTTAPKRATAAKRTTAGGARKSSRPATRSAPKT